MVEFQVSIWSRQRRPPCVVAPQSKWNNDCLRQKKNSVRNMRGTLLLWPFFSFFFFGKIISCENAF